jgi:competence protein ComEC
MMRWLTAIPAVLLSLWAAQAPRPLDIYWIDVEGGASTLIVTPAGESILFDSGYAEGERDPARIERVVRQEAGLARIDYLVTSHFHQDHAGGVPSLSRRIPIGRFIDHGDSVEKTGNGRTLFEQYVAVAAPRRESVKAGATLPLKGIEMTFVASDGQVFQPAAREANPLCRTFKTQPEDRGENGRSLGFALRAGDFDFVSLGDLSWNFQARLSCPANLLGKIDLFQATHHAVRDDVLPQQMWAMAPAVTVMNNGPEKGAGVAAVKTILQSPTLEDLWSLHRRLENSEKANAPEALTANLGATDGCQGFWIRARVPGDGTYTLTNSRTGFSRTYKVRR